MALDDDISNLVEESRGLTTTVTNLIKNIRDSLAGAISDLANYKSTISNSILSPCNTYSKTITCSETGDVTDKIREAFADGTKGVRLFIDFDTTAYMESKFTLPDGAFLKIVGRSKETSIFEARRADTYVAGSLSHADHLNIAVIGLSSGSAVYCSSVKLRQKPMGGRASPYEHGIFIAKAYGFGAGFNPIKLVDCTVDIYDCLLYCEGQRSSWISIILDRVEMNKLDNGDWFAPDDGIQNCGIIGIGSWSYAGIPIMYQSQTCVFGENVKGVIDCWNKGLDKTETLINYANASHKFIALVK